MNIEKLNGHDDTFVNFSKVIKWIKNHPRVNEFKHPYSFKQLTRRQENKAALTNWLNSLYYKFDENNNLKIVGDKTKAFSGKNSDRRYLSKKCLDILKVELVKRIYNG